MQSEKHKLKKIALIGRPNVGKSTMFNLLTGSRKAIVKNQPGVTRDIQTDTAEIWGNEFEIIDVGGLTDAADIFSQKIRVQVAKVMAESDLLLVIMDGRAGLCPEDRDLMRLVDESRKKFLLVVNKVDSTSQSDLMKSEFYEFGVDVIDTSFEQRRGLSGIFEWIVANVEDAKPLAEEPDTFAIDGEDGKEESGEEAFNEEASCEGEVEDSRIGDKKISIAVIGKPNAGKSSLCNRLIGEEKMMVTDIAGTTIDSIDSDIEMNGREYSLIDTAGLRRRSKRKDDVEVISSFKSHDAIDRSDLVLIMIDGTIGPSDQDAKLISYAMDNHKGILFVVNKLDLGEESIPAFRKTLRARITHEFHFYHDLPVVFVSAKTGAGFNKMYEEIEEIVRKLYFKISTSELNKFFTEVIRQAPSPVKGTRNVKFYYLTQTKQTPPSFIAFANYPEAVDDSYKRFLTKRIQKRWGLEGLPIRMFVMKSKNR